jgi:tRNA dimethylallyltransferase
MTTVSAVLIAGPTASGKSALALDLADRLGGVIVNADSMQVYRDLRIITARPTLEDEERVPHRLYGFVDAAEDYSVGRWCRDVEKSLKEIVGQGRVPILVGGTGLYFKALTTGLAAVPPVPADIRAGVRGRLQREGAPALHAAPDGQRPVTHSARAGSRAGDRAPIIRLAQGRHAGFDESRQRREDLPHLRAQGTGSPHRDALCGNAERRCTG